MIKQACCHLAWKGRLILPFAFLLCAGCAQNAAQTSKSLSRLESQLQDLRAFQAEQTAQISTLQSELREVRGRMDQLEFHNRPKDMPQPPVFPGAREDASNLDFSSLKDKGKPPPIVPLVALEDDEQRAGAMKGESARYLYDGFSALRQGKYGDAAALFQEALAQSYNTSFYPNILFWIGVSNDGLADNKAALKAYHELVSSSPKHERAPLALLRQGSVFIRLRDSGTARLTFEKLIAEYPKTSEAQSAKQRIKDLRG